MAVITAITVQKNDRNRCNIELDGRFYCGLERVTVLSHRLAAGQEITPERLAAIQAESERQTAFDRALDILSYSAKTEREVRERLEKKGFLGDTIDETVRKLKGYGYLDDAAYARAYAESAGKKKGSRLIEAELKRKGVAEEEIRAALAESDESQTAAEVLRKYMRAKTPDKATLRRAFSYLLSKGFDYDTAHDALAGLADEDRDD